MSVEKLRRETAGFDITFVLDPETNEYTVEKQLPKGLKPEAFIGHVCQIKIEDSVTVSGSFRSTTQQARYAPVKSVYESKSESVSTNYYALYYTIYVVVDFCDENGSHDTTIVLAYYPEGKRNAPDSTASVWSQEHGFSCGSLSISSVTLTSETDNETGDVTFSGTGIIDTRKNLKQELASDGLITMSYKDNVGGSNRTNYTYNKISMLYAPIASPYDMYLKLSSYWIYPADQVTNASVVIVDSTEIPSTRYPGFKRYDIQVSFTVPAANIKTYPNI